MDELLVERRGAVTLVTLNRPDAHNSITAAMAVALAETMDAFAADDSARVLVVTGAGDRAFWKAAMQGDRSSDEDLAHATRLIHETGALPDTLERARYYGRRAIDALAPFPAGRARNALTEAVEFAVARAY